MSHSPRGDMHTDICAALEQTPEGGALYCGFILLLSGYIVTMSDDITEDRVAQRAAELLPEELAAGSDDPHAQAEAILRDSDAREAGLDGAGADGLGPDSVGPHSVGPDGVGPAGVGPDGVGFDSSGRHGEPERGFGVQGA